MQANDELVAARVAIVELLAEIEDIELRQNPRIEAEWQVVIGVWENKLLEAQIAMRRAKRRYNMVQACVNTEKPVDMDEIESKLDTEFEQWKQQLDSAVNTYQAAVAAQMTAVHIDMEEARAQKRLFRKLAKRLHPDLNPGLNEQAQRMFELAKLAYQQGDRKILESLEISTRSLEPDPWLPETLVEAQAELAVLEGQGRELEQRIANIKAEKPYCLRALLNDSAWVEAHIKQLQIDLKKCQVSENDYNRRCEESMEQND